jgi:prepilin-type N-terminal cleavage/methylation domain-containing protein
MNTQITNTETSAKKDEKGFTLVELLIVIVILGILSTIVVFSVRGLTGKANKNACKIDARSMQTAFEAYYADNGKYPAVEADITGGGYMDKVTGKWTITYTALGASTPTLGLKAGSACVLTDLP